MEPVSDLERVLRWSAPGGTLGGIVIGRFHQRRVVDAQGTREGVRAGGHGIEDEADEIDGVTPSLDAS